jgi:hypothetical protein
MGIKWHTKGLLTNGVVMAVILKICWKYIKGVLDAWEGILNEYWRYSKEY